MINFLNSSLQPDCKSGRPSYPLCRPELLNFNLPVALGTTLIAFPLGQGTAKVEVAQNQTDKGFKLHPAPDLANLAEKELMPVVPLWFANMVAMLPSDQHTAPETVIMKIRDDMGGTPAYAVGNNHREIPELGPSND